MCVVVFFVYIGLCFLVVLFYDVRFWFFKCILIFGLGYYLDFCFEFFIHS